MSLKRLAAIFGAAGATALGGCAAYVSPYGDVSVGVSTPVYVAPTPRYYAPPPAYYYRPYYGRPHYRHW